jgi:AcrR family transcriptional regulator
MTADRGDQTLPASPDASTPRRGPGRPRALTEAEVVDAAMALAERDGVAGLSMRALARRLGVPLMTVYGYVPNKRALDALVADGILAEVRVPDADEGAWDVRLHSLLCDARRILVERPQLAHGDAAGHASAIDLVHSGALGRQATRLATSVLELLHDGGFDRDDQLTCFRALFIYVTGYVERDRGRPGGPFEPGRTTRSALEDFAIGLDALIHGLEQRLVGRAPDPTPPDP